MRHPLIDPSGATELAAMLLSVKGRNLLLPVVSVAEVVCLSPLRELENVPSWLRGVTSWRGLEIPVISFEAINDDPFVTPSDELRAAVLNGSDRVPFYGILTRGTPRMLRVSADEIVVNKGAAPGPAESMAVSASGEEAAIPNLEWLERQLERVMEQLVSLTD